MTGTGSKDAAAVPMTAANARAEFGPDGWQVQQGPFCWSAVRRPTPTAVEVITGRDLDHLAAKLRAETGGRRGERAAPPARGRRREPARGGCPGIR